MEAGASLAHLASLLELPEDAVEVSAVDDVFGSLFRVTEAAIGSVGIGIAAVCAFDRARNGRNTTGSLDGRHAAAAFHSERLVHLRSGRQTELWDPIAGNYPTADGWIRLHTNLPRHRAAALGVLGVAPERDKVAAAVTDWASNDLEEAVMNAGGVAAHMRTRTEYFESAQHGAVLERPVIDLRFVPGAGHGRPVVRGETLDGVRVLDLSRVIAGPVAGRFLAAFGADVVRVDPPLEDGVLVELDTCFGKRRTNIDLHEGRERRRFEELVSEADVLFESFRPNVLARLGFPDERLRELAPDLIIGHLSAYSDRGPWAGRRGFDSVVQVATGLAHACGFDPVRGPGRLPAQALDHATGYLLAAGIVTGLLRRAQYGRASTVNVSLARTGEWFDQLGRQEASEMSILREDVQDLMDVWSGTAWGVVEHLRPPGAVGNRIAEWATAATPRSDAPVAWAPKAQP